MSYIPAQEPSVDPQGVADFFSEYLINSYGRYYVVEPPYQHLDLDGVNKIFRNKSVHCYRGNEGWKNAPISTDAFYFSFDNPVDLTYMEKFSVLAHLFDRYYDNTQFTVPILTGDFIISLTDINNLAIYSPFVTKATNLKQWNTGVIYDRTPIEFTKDQFSGIALPQFDWTKVKAVTFYVGTREVSIFDFLPPNGYDIWIDGGPFFLLSSAQSILAINCVNQLGVPVFKKNMQLTDNANPSVTTPYTIPQSFTVSPSSYTIKITDSDFVGWSDGTAGPKTVTVNAGNNTTLTAVFKGGSTTPDETDLTTLALVGGAIAIGGLALYYFRRGK